MSAAFAKPAPSVANGFEQSPLGASVADGAAFTFEPLAGATEAADASQVKAHQPFAYAAPCGEPEPFVGAANARYLNYSTGEACLWRKCAAEPSAAGELFVDTLVRLTPWADGANPLSYLQDGERFQLWTRLDEDGRTNLFVTALLYDDDGWETTVTTNAFRIANALDLSADRWRRLTVRAVADVTRAHDRNPAAYPDGIQGFLVWLDGELLRTDEGCGSFSDGYVDFLAFEPDPDWGWLDWRKPADLAVAELLQSGTVFADLRGGGAEGVTGFGMAGMGDVDDLTVTAAQPRGFVASVDFMLLGEGDAAFAEEPKGAVLDWLDGIGATAAEAAADAHAHESYLLNLGLGLNAAPQLRIVRMEAAGAGAWDVTVRVLLPTGTVRLKDGLNGELVVLAADTLAGLATAQPCVRPFSFSPDRTELTVRIPSAAGAFYRLGIR